jgi:hypothetical protein
MAFEIPQIGLLSPNQVGVVTPNFVWWANSLGQTLGWVNSSNAPVYWA